MNVLESIRVIEFSTGIAGPYAGKLFADAGADVVKVEPPGGDPGRARSYGDSTGEPSALFQHLNAAKKSVVSEPDGSRAVELIAGADLVIESFAPARFDVEALLRSRPELVILSITPFGRRGSWQNRPSTNFTIQAASGSIGNRGRKDQVPFQAGGRLSEWCAGAFGAVGALAAVMRALETGSGEHVDCSILATDHLIGCGNVCVRDSVLGHPHSDQPARIIDVPSIERTLDGYVGFNLNTRQQFEAFVAMIGHSELAGSSWQSADYRMNHAAEWDGYVKPWMLTRSTAQILDTASMARIPVAPVHSGETLSTDEHFRYREVIRPFPGAQFVHPQPPYRINGERPRVRGPAPHLDADADTVGAGRETIERKGVKGQLPFKGLRVLDATTMWAGPLVGQVLAALGADVIHLESIQRLDLGRLKADGASGGPQAWELGHTWFMINWNKRDLTLDLTNPRGLELVERLLPHCDVLVENYAPRVFEKFGLTKDRVLELNPNIVFARMPAYGLDGPRREYIGFAQTMEQMSGLAWRTGHVDDDTPQVPRGPCDPLAGYHSLFAIMVSLFKRRQGGGGSLVESAMAEAALNAAAESLVTYSAYGVVLGRTGNRSPDAAPQGLYPCRGKEKWLALTIENDEQWSAACEEFGSPPWAVDPDLKCLEGRLKAHDLLDREIRQWSAQRDLESTVESFLGRGIPAASVTDPRRADSQVQLNEFGYFEAIDHPVLGVHRAPTLPFRYRSVENWVTSSAPLLGEHNNEILEGILGLSEAEMADLASEEIIGVSPLGSNPSFDL
jgi:crotonobetainyl-CoA:carnitine CoA-transferase CaiB-like acyl-CoA transferase